MKSNVCWKITALPLFLSATLLITGCDTAGTAPAASAQKSTESAEDEAASPSGESAGVDVAIKDYEGIQQVIQGKQGRIVVMDCWSTYCPPCMKEFHNLVELHHEYPDDVACVSLNFDYTGGKGAAPDDTRDDVIDFLKEKGATFDNMISSVPAEDLYQQMGFKTAAVPAVFVYDRKGDLAKQFEGEVSYADVRQLVADLLAEAGDK